MPRRCPKLGVVPPLGKCEPKLHALVPEPMPNVSPLSLNLGWCLRGGSVNLLNALV